MKMIGNVSNWLSYAGIALIKVAGSAGSTVYEAEKATHSLEQYRNGTFCQLL